MKLDKNPYLSADKEYFLKRREKEVFAKFRAAVYKKAGNLCALCQQSLHNGENVELHHINPVKEGGTYKLKNITPLHQICHQQITHKKPLGTTEREVNKKSNQSEVS
jgi:5-methylcytosine-specific restriction endonuclease McrA